MRQLLTAMMAAIWFAATATGPAADPAADGRILAAAMEAAGRDDWAGAEALAARASDPAVAEIMLWLRLQRGEGAWADYAAFSARNPEWPRIAAVRAQAERAMPRGLPAAEILAFFADRAPETVAGALRLAAALARQDAARAETVLVAAWTGLEMTQGEREAFAATHPRLTRAHGFSRVDEMLWRGELGQAEAAIRYLDAAHAALARARIALRRGSRGVDRLIEAVPARLAGDPGLAHDRFEWRVRRDRWEDATALLLDRSASAESLGRPEAWAKRRMQLAHRAMREGDPRTAYRIASSHRMGRGTDFEQLEWFAGWVALRKLGDAQTALGHFRLFRDNVDTPISLGRAGYWLGRAYEALGDRAQARTAYRFAAAWQTSFYGQLAAERAGLAPDPDLAGPALLPDWRGAAFLKRPSGRAALLFHHADEPGRVWQFLVTLARAEDDPATLAAMAHMALDLGRWHVAVRVAKAAAARGTILMEAYYPVTPLAGFASTVPAELTMSIARTESEFNEAAVSPAGARGVMQLMPATARKVAKDLGLSHRDARLTQDWTYNATLGTGYLAEQMSAFGALPLVAAAYNAGPHRVETWLARYGDPRTDPDAALDWIEGIPFTETRNYVMRVMEGLHVYRARLNGRVAPIRISADLGWRG